MKCQRIKVDEPFIPASEDDATRVQHLLADPKPDHVSVDGVFSFGKENSWKRLGFEDFSNGFGFGLERDWGGLNHSNTRGQDEMELGVLDGLLDGVDEVDDFHAANDISGACEDFLLDVELAGKISDLDFAPYRRPHIRNSSSESRSPGFNGSSNAAPGLSESTRTIIVESESKNNSLEKKLVKCELNDFCGGKWEYQALGTEDAIMTSRDSEKLDALADDPKHFESGISSDENEKEAIQAGKISNLLRQKRVRKPTKRFIEEFLAPKSKHFVETEKSLGASSKNIKRLKIKSLEEQSERASTYVSKESSLIETITQETLDDDEKLSDLRSKCLTARKKNSALNDEDLRIRSQNGFNCVREFKSAPRDECLEVTKTQAAYKSWSRRRRQKKNPSVSDSDDEYTASESKDDRAKRRRSKKGADRRKNQRMWTPSEVSRLIDGISQYGTGRWTDIKRLFFPSSTYRTPIDLRDKWRNLLRASSVEKESKKESEQKLKQNMCPLPKSVVRRIRELASLHPYPRFTPGGRYIRKKKN